MWGLFPVIVLALMGLINLGRGAIHVFAPDGGAGSIAGLDLSSNAPTIIALFASLGFGQVVTGAFQLFVAARLRDVVWLMLAMQAADTALTLVNLYLWKPLPVTVPGQPFNVVLLVVQIAALWIALAKRRAAA